jgi:hypothetical protein
MQCEFVRQMPLFFLATDAAPAAFLAAINGLRIYNRDALLYVPQRCSRTTQP